MSNCWYISIYDQNILFKNIIDDIIFKHSEGVDLESLKERMKLGDDLFDVVKTTMMKFWKETIDELELKDCIHNRINKLKKLEGYFCISNQYFYLNYFLKLYQNIFFFYCLFLKNIHFKLFIFTFQPIFYLNYNF